MKYIINIILKTIIFIFFFLLFYLYISKLFMHKENWRGDLSAIKSFYEHKEKTLDVVFLGTSHVYTGISNWQLWNEHGIASYNFSNSSQPFQITYFMLEEVIRVQKPKLIVIDLFGLVLPSSAGLIHAHANLDYMPLSKTKIKSVNSLIKNRKSEFFCPMIKYHTRWNNLNKKDFQTLKHIGLGSDLLFETKKNPSFEIVNNDIEDKNINIEYLSILDKMISLCQNEKIDLLFTTLPYHAPSKPNAIKISHIKQQQIFNNVNKLFLEKKIKYLNFFHLLDEFSFNWDTDMNDSSHPNINGAHKITSFLGKYIKTNYNIPDRRLDPAYTKWNEDYKLYVQDTFAQELNATKDSEKYLELLISKKEATDNTCIFFVKTSEKNINNKHFNSLGIDVNSNNCIAIIDEGKVVYNRIASDIMLQHEYKIGRLPIKLVSDVKGKNSSIKVDGIEQIKNKSGITIVIYDKLLKKVSRVRSL